MCKITKIQAIMAVKNVSHEKRIAGKKFQIPA
jgi:hypothetical protein